MDISLYVVGGCVRDLIKESKFADTDFLLNAPAEEFAKKLVNILGGGYIVFGNFKTVRFFTESGIRLDFAQFRREVYTKPAALPVTKQANTVQEDLIRRDFTVNAMALEIAKKTYELIDPFGGYDDVKNGIVRILHDKSFEDDPTRIYRAARFCGRFGWHMDNETKELFIKAIENNFPALLSRERLRNELIKILSEDNPSPALNILVKYGAMKFVDEHFAAPEGLNKVNGFQNRLTAIACAMKENGVEFIENLHLTKAVKREILNSLKNK